jgi:uncharacterized cofD-like protein
MFDRNNRARVTVIGGGTGLSVLLRGMKKREAFDLSAVVTMADDGGNSGALREDLGMLPPGDVRSCLLALADEESVMQEILRYRFTEGRLAGNSMGNLILAALNDIYGSFEQAVSKVSDILKVQGRVIPVSNEEIRLCAELANGIIVLGESSIPKVALQEGTSIAHLFLSPFGARASEEACGAVCDADLIMIGPGSLYTSIVPNFLAVGISEALALCRGIKIYVANVMTQPGETDFYGIREHVETLRSYSGGVMPDYVIANNRALDTEALEAYISDGARQIIPNDADRAYLSENGVSLIEDDFIEMKVGYIRHDSTRIAAVAEKVLSGRGV